MVKQRINITMSQDNLEWLKQMTKTAGLPVSLFIDSLILGMRTSFKDGLTQREAISVALEQIAKGLKK